MGLLARFRGFQLLLGTIAFTILCNLLWLYAFRCVLILLRTSNRPIIRDRNLINWSGIHNSLWCFL